MDFTTPPFLQPGDLIAIAAPARKISSEELRPCLERIRAEGFEYYYNPRLFAQHHQFGGTDAERTADMNELLANPAVKAILFARGGYGCLRIVDQIKWSVLQKNPKWLVGFSDLTVFLQTAFLHKVESLHAPLAINFMGQDTEEKSLHRVFQVLRGERMNYFYSSTQAIHRNGKASGKLVGGNLTLVHNLIGTPSDIDMTGCILFLEDVDEYLYHLDRMVLHLKRSGKLAQLNGLIVGGFTKLKDNEQPFGMNYVEIIREAVREYAYPVCFDFPAGHQSVNDPLVMGRIVELEVNGKDVIVRL